MASLRDEGWTPLGPKAKGWARIEGDVVVIRLKDGSKTRTIPRLRFRVYQAQVEEECPTCHEGTIRIYFDDELQETIICDCCHLRYAEAEGELYVFQ